MTATTLSGTLAEWVVSLRFEDLPAAVVSAAKESIRDTLAGAVLGAHTGRVQQFGALMGAGSTSESATSILRGSGVPVAEAAMYNAICAHGCELDDTLLGAGGHPGSVVVPAALAVAEGADLSGADLITAVVAGYELMYRTVAPIFPSNQQRGFQATGLGGPFAAAATVASLTGADAAEMQDAFGIAGTYAAGLLEYDQTGGESKRLYAGLAARSGIESVELSRRGISGPRTIYEGRRGVFAAFGDELDEELATVGLGTDFSIVSKRRVKRYPTVGSFHGALDAIGELMDDGLRPDDIERIDVFLAPLSVVHGGAVTIPTDTVSAQFSCRYSVAVRILFGSNDLAFYEDSELWADARVLELGRKIFVLADDRLDALAEQGRGRVAVTTTDGRVLRNDQPVPAGRPDNPLSDAEFQQRFTRFTRVLPDDARHELDDELSRLESVKSVRPLASSLAASAADSKHVAMSASFSTRKELHE
jgi:2-methylcitrate dehydratase PrpD